MKIITETPELQTFCQELAASEYITVDTEFVREKTYWPKLCLVQLAGPAEAAIIDVLAPGIELEALFALMRNPAVLKVFHAARQDIEIFLNLMGEVPAPVFDTQIAAMVCGFGESVGYEALVTALARTRIDKSLRFTDWAIRPLEERQLHYAISDVTHLRVIYEKLSRKLDKNGRLIWLKEEMDAISDPASYMPPLEHAWQRLKPRSDSPKFLAILRELAAWREAEARARNLPRQWVLKDDTLLELAARAPSSVDSLARARGLSRGTAEGPWGEAILAAIAKGKECLTPPSLPQRFELPRGMGSLVEMLKMLLKLAAEEHDVAAKLIASGDDLDILAAGSAQELEKLPALHGWRGEVFGENALKLKTGQIALGYDPVKSLPRIIGV